MHVLSHPLTRTSALQLHINGGDEHLREGGVKRKLYHLSAEGSEGPCIVQSSQDPQLVHRVENVILRMVAKKLIKCSRTYSSKMFWRNSKDHFCHEIAGLTCGGGSMKWNWRRSWTPSDFNSSTTLARLVRCISGTVVFSISVLYADLVYNR